MRKKNLSNFFLETKDIILFSLICLIFSAPSYIVYKDYCTKFIYYNEKKKIIEIVLNKVSINIWILVIFGVIMLINVIFVKYTPTTPKKRSIMIIFYYLLPIYAWFIGGNNIDLKEKIFILNIWLIVILPLFLWKKEDWHLKGVVEGIISGGLMGFITWIFFKIAYLGSLYMGIVLLVVLTLLGFIIIKESLIESILLSLGLIGIGAEIIILISRSIKMGKVILFKLILYSILAVIIGVTIGTIIKFSVNFIKIYKRVIERTIGALIGVVIIGSFLIEKSVSHSIDRTIIGLITGFIIVLSMEIILKFLNVDLYSEKRFLICRLISSIFFSIPFFLLSFKII